MNTPLVSIIIPSFNRAELIKETLDSVLAQTYPHWECIIVDDGSTDGTQEVIKSYVAKDNRFKFHQRHRDPKGAPTCRNIGLDKAEGEYVIFLDSDDLLAPWCLEERKYYIEKLDFVDLLVSECIQFTDGKLKQKLCTLYGSTHALDDFLSFDLVWFTPCVTWKKRFLENIEGWYELATHAQDVELYIRALARGAAYGWASEVPDCFGRVGHQERITSSKNNIHRIHNFCNTLLKISSELKKEIERNSFLKKSRAVILNQMLEFNIPSKELISKDFKDALEVLGFHFTKLIYCLQLYRMFCKTPLIRRVVLYVAFYINETQPQYSSSWSNERFINSNVENKLITKLNKYNSAFDMHR